MARSKIKWKGHVGEMREMHTKIGQKSSRIDHLPKCRCSYETLKWVFDKLVLGFWMASSGKVW